MRVLVFGDSTAQGYYDLEMGGWVNLLFVERLKQKVRNPGNNAEVFNVSISGDTTRRVIDRIMPEIKVRKWADEPVALVFAIGVNDAMESNGQPISSPEQYTAELTELYDSAKTQSDHLIFVGPESVDESESIPWKFNSGTNELVWRNERIKLFDQALRNFCKAKGVTYIPVFDSFVTHQQKGEQLHADGLHPNAAGHRLLHACVQPVLDALTNED